MERRLQVTGLSLLLSVPAVASPPPQLEQTTRVAVVDPAMVDLLLDGHGAPDLSRVAFEAVFADGNGPIALGYHEGYLDGQVAGRDEGMLEWYGSGAGSGCLLGGLGGLCATAVGGLVEPRLPYELYDTMQQYPDDYTFGFSDGYARRVKSRRATAAFVGGAVSSAVLLGVGFALVYGVGVY